MKKHYVKDTSFFEDTDRNKNQTVEVIADGTVSFPSKLNDNSTVIVNLHLQLGNDNERLHWDMHTITLFEVSGIEEEFSIDEMREQCLSISLDKLRETVKNVSVAFGRAPIDIPPFSEDDL